MKGLIDYIIPPIPNEDTPREVLNLWACAALDIPVGSETYSNIYKFPEWFPEENEYKKRWDAIPKEEIDEYYKVAHKIDWDKTGYPYPEVAGLGIIGRVAHWNTENYREIEDKHIANGRYMAEKFKEDEKKRIELFNKMFNKYGIKEE